MFNRSKRFKVITGVLSTQLLPGGPWNRIILRNNADPVTSTDRIGYRLITPRQDGADTIDYSTCEWDLGPGETIEIDAAVIGVKHVSSAGTPALDICVLSH